MQFSQFDNSSITGHDLDSLRIPLVVLSARTVDLAIRHVRSYDASRFDSHELHALLAEREVKALLHPFTAPATRTCTINFCRTMMTSIAGNSAITLAAARRWMVTSPSVCPCRYCRIPTAMGNFSE
jgi:hypothetical protein